MIKEQSGQFIVYSEEGKRLSRPFASKEEAEERLKEIEMFKHDGKDLAKYKDQEVLLNSPVETPDKKTKYQVFSLNMNDDIVSIRFNGEPTAIDSSDPSTPAYWNKQISGTKSISFTHKPFFDMASKTIRSVRDGVQEYLGIELEIEPFNKVFTVYRSPETIAEIASKLDGLPITNDHVDVNEVSEVKNSDIIGSIKGTEIIEFDDEDTNSSLYLENPIALSDKGLALRSAGKKEFSLGYRGRLKPHDVYDFEQFAFTPTHLALVDSARGGSVLTFVDKRTKDMGDKKRLSKVFLDADGNPNLQQIVEIAQELPEALKKIPVDKLQEVIPMLQEIVAIGKSGDTPEVEVEEGESPEEMPEMMDADYEDMEPELKDKFEDSKLFKSIIKHHQKSFADGKAFKDAIADGIDNAVKQHSVVIEKAVKFVDEQYSFADKSTDQIMRDALAVEHGDAVFEDSEIKTAFKLLKRSNSSLMNFGDSKDSSALETRIQQDLEG